jgi:hypothetical protein
MFCFDLVFTCSNITVVNALNVVPIRVITNQTQVPTHKFTSITITIITTTTSKQQNTTNKTNYNCNIRHKHDVERTLAIAMAKRL